MKEGVPRVARSGVFAEGATPKEARLDVARSGQAAAIATMIPRLAVIINPAGTVGEANRLVQDASLGRSRR